MRAQLLKIRQMGFTLIELLIVVIILAILAAIVIPQFTSATKDAQEAALDTNLSALRSAIELYKVQHNSANPGVTTAVAGAACAAGTGTGTAGTAQSFMDQLLYASDVTGATCKGPTAAEAATYKFGPYLRKGVPADPVTQKGAVVGEITVTTTGAPITAGAGGGWAYDTVSGQFIANNTANDSKGKAYSTH